MRADAPAEGRTVNALSAEKAPHAVAHEWSARPLILDMVEACPGDHPHNPVTEERRGGKGRKKDKGGTGRVVRKIQSRRMEGSPPEKKVEGKGGTKTKEKRRQSKKWGGNKVNPRWTDPSQG